MKITLRTFILCFCAVIFSMNTSLSINPISQNTSENTFVKEHSQHKWVSKLKISYKKKLTQLKEKISGLFYKVGGILDHPTRKWFWFWLIFGLIGAILLVTAVIAGIGTGGGVVFRILYYLGLGSSLFSSASFVIWLIKLIQG